MEQKAALLFSRYSWYKHVKYTYFFIFRLITRASSTVRLNNNGKLVDAFEEIEGVTFGGYYDVSLYAPSIGVVGHHLADDGFCKILCKNGNGEVSTIGETKAFNLQQGARLTIVNQKVVYNSIHDGYLNSVWMSKNHNKFTAELFPYPIQSIDQSGTRFCVISYADLKLFADEYSFDSEFKELIGSKELLIFQNFEIVNKIKISELELGLGETDTIYFNHFTYSPNSKFLVGLIRNAYTKKSRFITINLNTKKCNLPGSFTVISHYCFIDDHTVVYWGRKNQRSGYFKFDLETGVTDQISELASLPDGHPSILDTYMVVDTYPDRFRQSKIFMYDLGRGTRNLLGQFHQPLEYFGANRCDLHPVWINDDTLSIDSAHMGSRRMYLIQNIGAS